MNPATQIDYRLRHEYVKKLERHVHSLEQELRVLRAVTEALAGNSPAESYSVGLMRVLPSGQCLYANEWVQKMAGPAPDRNRGSWLDIVDDADRNHVGASFENAVRECRPFEVDFKVANPGAEPVCVRALGTPEQTSDSQVRFHLVLVDVSASIRLRLDNQRNLDLLRESRDELRQFAYVASHDLNEPLRMIASYSQLLARRYSSQIGNEGAEYVSFVTSAVGRMKSLLQDLVSYSCCLNADFKMSTFSSAAAAQWALMNLHSELQASGGTVEIGGLPVCRGDQNQIVKVFQHLIQNAIKFRSVDPPRISIDAEQAADRWRFGVTDNGLGIDTAFHERIFHVFKRLHGKEVPGTGVGLAICKRIVEGHGGRMWVRSEPGRGSTFFFELPVS